MSSTILTRKRSLKARTIHSWNLFEQYVMEEYTINKGTGNDCVLWIILRHVLLNDYFNQTFRVIIPYNN